MTVLDASAVLAYLQGEKGAEQIEGLLESGAVVGAVNWSEVAQKVRGAGRDWDLARALLVSYDVDVESATISDAEWAAARWVKGEGLSLADRLCLALGHRLGVDVVTTDRSWGSGRGVRQVQRP